MPPAQSLRLNRKVGQGSYVSQDKSKTHSFVQQKLQIAQPNISQVGESGSPTHIHFAKRPSNLHHLHSQHTAASIAAQSIGSRPPLTTPFDRHVKESTSRDDGELFSSLPSVNFSRTLQATPILDRRQPQFNKNSSAFHAFAEASTRSKSAMDFVD